MRTIDLNCDLGEGGGFDRELMSFVSSANIACGGHAGDDDAMRFTAALAAADGVVIGAHPGFEDREHFGRRELALSSDEIEQLVVRQVNALRRFAPIAHVKPHGALYNLAARDARVADAISRAVKAIDPTLVLYALSGSELARVGRARGLRVAEEAFADRTYRSDGSLTARSERGAVISDPDAAAAQAVGLARDGVVHAVNGTRVTITVDTLCVHGDTAGAVAFARRIRAALTEAGISIAAARR